MTRIGVHRYKQVGLVLVGHRRARLQRNESIVIAGIDNVGAQSVLQQLAQPQRYIQHQVLFHEPARTDGAGIVTAVAGIHNDLSDL